MNVETEVEGGPGCEPQVLLVVSGDICGDEICGDVTGDVIGNVGGDIGGGTFASQQDGQRHLQH